MEFSWGATEAKVVDGLVDAVVEVTETGSTIRANKLRIVHELMRSKYSADCQSCGPGMIPGSVKR